MNLPSYLTAERPKSLSHTEVWEEPATKEEMLEWMNTKSRDFMTEVGYATGDYNVQCDRNNKQIRDIIGFNFQQKRNRRYE